MVSLMESAYLALAFVVFVITVSIGASVLSSTQTGQYNTTLGNCATTYATNTSCWTVASNATGQGLTGMTNLAGNSGVIGTILGAVIIIGLLMGAFVMGRK